METEELDIIDTPETDLDGLDNGFDFEQQTEELTFQFSSVEAVVQSLDDQESWEKISASEGGDVLKKDAQGWVYKTGNGTETSITAAVAGTDLAERHEEILENLYSQGFAVSEFIKPDSKTLVREVYFADERGRISYEIFARDAEKETLIALDDDPALDWDFTPEPQLIFQEAIPSSAPIETPRPLITINLTEALAQVEMVESDTTPVSTENLIGVSSQPPKPEVHDLKINKQQEPIYSKMSDPSADLSSVASAKEEILTKADRTKWSTPLQSVLEVLKRPFETSGIKIAEIGYTRIEPATVFEPKETVLSIDEAVEHLEVPVISGNLKQEKPKVSAEQTHIEKLRLEPLPDELEPITIRATNELEDRGTIELSSMRLATEVSAPQETLEASGIQLINEASVFEETTRQDFVETGSLNHRNAELDSASQRRGPETIPDQSPGQGSGLRNTNGTDLPAEVLTKAEKEPGIELVNEKPASVETTPEDTIIVGQEVLTKNGESVVYPDLPARRSLDEGGHDRAEVDRREAQIINDVKKEVLSANLEQPQPVIGLNLTEAVAVNEAVTEIVLVPDAVATRTETQSILPQRPLQTFGVEVVEVNRVGIDEVLDEEQPKPIFDHQESRIALLDVQSEVNYDISIEQVTPRQEEPKIVSAKNKAVERLEIPKSETEQVTVIEGVEVIQVISGNLEQTARPQPKLHKVIDQEILQTAKAEDRKTIEPSSIRLEAKISTPQETLEASGIQLMSEPSVFEETMRQDFVETGSLNHRNAELDSASPAPVEASTGRQSGDPETSSGLREENSVQNLELRNTHEIETPGIKIIETDGARLEKVIARLEISKPEIEQVTTIDDIEVIKVVSGKLESEDDQVIIETAAVRIEQITEKQEEPEISREQIYAEVPKFEPLPDELEPITIRAISELEDRDTIELSSTRLAVEFSAPKETFEALERINNDPTSEGITLIEAVPSDIIGIQEVHRLAESGEPLAPPVLRSRMETKDSEPPITGLGKEVVVADFAPIAFIKTEASRPFTTQQKLAQSRDKHKPSSIRRPVTYEGLRTATYPIFNNQTDEDQEMFEQELELALAA